MPRSRAAGLLLSTTSAFALLLARPALAAGATDNANVQTPAGTFASGFTNSGQVDFVLIEGGSTVTGNVLNNSGATIGIAGGGTTPALEIDASTLNGAITNNGTIIAGGGGGTIQGVLLTSTATVSGAITNNGTITGSSSTATTANGIEVDATTSTSGIVNGGTITTALTSSTGSPSATGIYLAGSPFGGGVSNNGTISTSATTTAAGSDAAAYGICAEANTVSGNITNSGSISASATGPSCAFAAGIYSPDNLTGSLTNAAGASITASATSSTGSIYAFGLCADSTTIGGSVVNNGNISVTGSTGSTSDTDYNVYGIYADATTITGGVGNTGAISASFTGNCGNAYGMYVGGSTAGNVSNSGAITATATGNCGTAYGIYVDDRTSSGDVSNSGAITATASSNCAEAYGIYVGASTAGAISNSSIITATATAVMPSGFFEGTACAYGLYADTTTINGSVTNSGTITAAATVPTGASYGLAETYGLYVDATTVNGSITNSGTITATTKLASGSCGEAYAYGLYAGANTITGSVVNSGTITATVKNSTTGDACAYGIEVNAYTSLGGNLTNTGTVTANVTGAAGEAYGIYLYSPTATSGNIANNGTVSVSATVSGSDGIEATGIYADLANFGGAITNSGSITTTAAASGGSACAEAIGLDVTGTGTGATISNSGTIIAQASATGGGNPSAYGIYINDSSFTGTLSNSGTIIAGASATGGGTATATGIYAAIGSGTLTIVNTGTIAAATAIDLSASGSTNTVNQNGGTITGKILFSPQADTLNISGGTIVGGVMQASGASATVNLNGGSLIVPQGGMVSGIATFAQTGGTLGFQVSPAVASPQPTLTAGTVHISGGTVEAFETASAFTPGTTYVYSNLIQWTASNTGTTPSVTSNSPLFDASLVSSGNATAGSYTLDLVAVSPGSVPGLSPAQQSVANALPTPLLAVVTTLNAAQFQQAMTELSGTTHTTVTAPTLGSWQNFISTLGTRLASGGGYHGTLIGSIDGGNIKFASAAGQQMADAAPGIGGGNANANQPWGLWMRGFGVWANAPATATGPAYSQNTGGAVVGFDRAVSENVVAGVAANFTNTTALYAGGAGDSQSTDYQLAGYGQYTMGDWYAQGQVGAAIETLGEQRNVPFLGVSPSASFGGQSYAAYGETGYTFHRSGFLLTPLAGLGYTRVHTDAYTETGGGAADLAVAASDVNSLQTSFGGRAAMRFTLANGGEVQPEISAVWQHEFLAGEPSITSAFATAPNSAFTITGTRFSRESAVLGIGISSVTAAGPQVFFDYNAKVNGGYLANSVSAGLRISF